MPDPIVDRALRSPAYHELCALLGAEPDPAAEALGRARALAGPFDRHQIKFLKRCFQRVLAARHGWRYDVMSGQPVGHGASARHDRYRIVNFDPHDDAIGAVALARFERFGNLVIQLINAFSVAEGLGVDRIFVPDAHEFLPSRADAPIRIAPAPVTARNTLSGAFFRRGALFKDHDRDAMEGILARHVRPLLQPIFEAIPFTPVDLTVHIRAGDVFGQGEVHPSYGQPPLAFYTRAIGLCAARSVRIVFENRDNPVVDALFRWCARNGVAAEAQSGTLAQDIAALYGARRLAVSRGTFGWAIADLSPHIRELFGFVDGAARGTLPDIAVRRLGDGQGGYAAAVLARNWANTAEQRALMLSYPEAAIVAA